jgi:hypothetical protein
MAARIAEMQRIVDSNHPPDGRTAEADADLQLVNSWHSFTKNGRIVITRDRDGRTRWGLEPHAPTRNRLLFGPLETLDAWDLERETVAMERLCDLLSERMFLAYICAGQFLETSKRSGLTYLFRRCRPTLVLSSGVGRRAVFRFELDADEDLGVRILCALCLHPLAYYANTFCGAMTPTDDVIAHLLLMRGDEPLYWRRANQHPAYAPESGL